MTNSSPVVENRKSEPPKTQGVGRKGQTSLLSHGQPMIWLMGGALMICFAMIIGLLGLILIQGLSTFWPRPLVFFETGKGSQLGEEIRKESYRPEALKPDAEKLDVTRELIRVDNFEFNSASHNWVQTSEIKDRKLLPWAITIERLTKDGRFLGILKGFRSSKPGAMEETNDPGRAWELFQVHHPEVLAHVRQQEWINRNGIGTLNQKEQAVRRLLNIAQLDHGIDSAVFQEATLKFEQERQAIEGKKTDLKRQIEEQIQEGSYYELHLETADGKKKVINLDQVSRAYLANQLTFWQKIEVYLSRWWEFLSAEPRNANREGGVLPAIWGTAAMTLLMSIAVVPFGVMAALYLREYAKAGVLISIIRIAINNLAGVPGIVFGVFGLGFFCYLVGAKIDDVFYRPEKLIGMESTFGQGGLLWASLTLALLTLPVVIVATEESLAAVPGSMREGSYACGASKWQTIWRIVLPRATPGILTGMVLAMARGAGEVAPLMLLGLKKVAAELAVDNVFPYLHPQRSFMHLGFHIYDVGFQSPDSEAARPMVYTTTLLLLTLIATLSLAAMGLRARLRRRYIGSQF